MSVIKHIIFGIGFLCISVSAAFAQNGGNSFLKADYLWPTDASEFLSATFAETRSSHFHAAVDIKTWGQEGYRVFATRDGTVERIGISPNNYGKVIYLKHDDGSYSVYAHLMAFEERIQEMADSLRLENNYSFELNQTFGSQSVDVKQGDVIGYTGSTGIGPPHLHFEVRSPEDRPFNPLLTNLKITDTTPPKFRELSVEPLAPNALLDDEIQTRRFNWDADGNYDFGTVDVRGPVGLGVDVFDQADEVFNSYAVYSLTMASDADTLFHSKVDRFSYEKSNQMFLDRVYPLLQKTGAGFQRLFIADGNTLPFYEKTQNSGRLNLKEGKHPITITATDFFGNKSEAKVIINVASENSTDANERTETSKFVAEPSTRQPFSAAELADITWFTDWIRSINASTLQFEKAGSFIETQVSQQKDIVDLARPESVWMRDLLDRSALLHRLIPDRSSAVHSASQRLSIQFPEKTFFDTLSVALVEEELAADSIRVETLPKNQPLNRSFTMHYVMDEEQKRDSTLNWYRYDPRKNKLSFKKTSRKHSTLTTKADEMGTYYILPDTTAPSVEKPRIYRREDNKWIASVRVKDDRSGIDHQAAKFHINGERGIAEYEPEEDLLIYYLPDFEPRNKNELEIFIKDRAGNSTEQTFQVD